MEKLACIVEKIKKSEYLTNSIVAFMVDLLELYANGVFTPSDFADEYVRSLNMKKFYFSKMPKELALENLQVFGNELHLAEQLNTISLQAKKLGESEFTQKLLECVGNYAETYTIRKSAQK